MSVTVRRDPSVIALRDVAKTYANGKLALHGITLSVAPGEFISLVGASGCGKSTLLKIMAGLLAPSSGEISGLGGAGRADGRGYVFQDANLMPWRTVLRNTELPLEMQDVDRTTRRKRARQALATVGLAEYEAFYPRQLSGGMRMRASIARALVSDPRILFMDEPFGALDELTRQRLHGELQEIWQRNRLTIVFVTHNVYEAVFLSGRVVVLETDPGRIRDIVTVEQKFPRGHGFIASAAFGRHVQEITDLITGKAERAHAV
jgi:NitT/TauT family transport system ATP-binding protein